MTLIASRALLAVGRRDRPGDAFGRDPQHLCRGQSAQYGAGAVGSGRLWRRGAFGPLVGGILLSIYWGSVFLINVPIVLVVIAINAKVVPRASPRAANSRSIYCGGARFDCRDPDAGEREIGAEGQLALWLTALVALGGAAMLTWFIRKQLSAARPMDGYAPVHPSHNLKRGDDGDDGPITLVGFELLMAQEQQFVHQKNAVRGGDIYAAGNGGQRLQRLIAGLLVSRLGLREVATGGMCSAPSAFSAWR